MFQSLILLTKGVSDKKKRVTISYMEDFHICLVKFVEKSLKFCYYNDITFLFYYT